MLSNIYVQIRVQIRVIHVTGVSSDVGSLRRRNCQRGGKATKTPRTRVISRPNSATGRISVLKATVRAPQHPSETLAAID